MKRMPVVFSGHGDPMIALRHDKVTEGMRQTGDRVIAEYGRPKGILAISAHWYADSTYVQSAAEPEQVYDMYGFPQELYDHKYPVKGCRNLTDRVLDLLGDEVSINDTWGVDHGAWTVLTHMFPEADIPVVQLSVSQSLTNEECFEIGRSLAALREEGYLIFGSGNVVHNLMRVEWGNAGGTEMTLEFNQYIIDKITEGDSAAVIDYEEGPYASYAVPTPEHYLPLIYCLGAAEGDEVRVFNNICNLGSMAMTGFIFG